MLRIAQLLREMLSRRPAREELQRRGIYKGIKPHLTQTHCTAAAKCVILLLTFLEKYDHNVKDG